MKERMTLSGDDIYLFHQGSLFHSYRSLGAQLLKGKGQGGVRFAVWAPNAREVRVVGSFNGWDGSQHIMNRAGESGLWELYVPGLGAGEVYKYELIGASGKRTLKADPYAFYAEVRPNTASIVYPLDDYRWGDAAWQRAKRRSRPYQKPLNIYEAHLGTWKIHGIEDFLSYRELADQLVDYAAGMGYTHIELMPVMEHPFDRSWGYQITGFYAPTSRYGAPDDLKYLIDRCHQKGMGVILDWVPGHFCKDDHGLRLFDGTPLYEPADSRRAEKRDWGTLAFDFGRPEVMSFLISNAIYWMDQFHADGLRIDAVASMLDLSFGKSSGDWEPNRLGGTENLEAVAFIRKLNEAVFGLYPQALMMAEDSSDYPLVTRPTDIGGLGFNYKWNMGWMNDMLKYMEMDPLFRKDHHQLLTFSFMYTFNENYVLPFSHDEVVHGKKSLLDKMPGDYWQKFANLRVLFSYLMTHPGKKLLFMGGEIGQFSEWKDLEQVDWHLLDYEMHAKMQDFVRELNHFYREEPALWKHDHEPDGFEWIDPHDSSQSIISFIRKGSMQKETLVVICNFTPVVRHGYRIGVPWKGTYEEVWNSDRREFGGSGVVNVEPVPSEPAAWHGRPQSIAVTIPPLAAVILRPVKIQRDAHRNKTRNRKGDALLCAEKNVSLCSSPEVKAED